MTGVLKFLNRWCNRHYCTCFIDRWRRWDWSVCCKEHDLDYTYNPDGITRWRMDRRLFQCMREHAPLVVAIAVWCAVRVFGEFFIVKHPPHD